MGWWTKWLDDDSTFGKSTEAVTTMGCGRMSMERAQEKIVAAGRSGAKTLDLSDLGLNTLPPALADLTGLTTLFLTGNPLAELPDWLARLSDLRILNVNHCALRIVPAWIERLGRLETLWLMGNHLRDLPSELAHMAALSTIDLDANAFTDFPAALLASPHLTTLYISSNHLTRLPDAIDRLAQLIHLTLFNNQCTALPETLGNLGALRYLDVDDNALQSLPASLAKLQALQLLEAKNNRLSTLPKGIAQCRGLTRIDLAHNQLQSLPPQLSTLPLTELWLQGNPGLGLSAALLGEYVTYSKRNNDTIREPQGILATYFALQGAVELDASTTLNRLSNPATRQDLWRPRVFISYSSANIRAFNHLKRLLKPMCNAHGLLDTWNDRCIAPGQEWDRQIHEQLECADVILMLVSTDFLATDYITDIEVKCALARADAGECKLVSVILEDCGFEKFALAKYQALPDKAKPIFDFKPQRDGWAVVRKRLHAMLEELCAARGTADRQGLEDELLLPDHRA